MDDKPETKTCTKCSEEKIIADFQFRNGMPISQCRNCTNARKAYLKRMQRQLERQEKVANGEILIPTDPENNFMCNGCHQEKSKDQFRKNRKKCKDCERAHGREYRRGDHGKEKAQKWVKENQERMTELQANWYQNNKPKINKKYVERCNIDPQFNLKKTMGRKLSKALLYYNPYAENPKVEYLSCEFTHFVGWLEYCFTTKMTFENRGRC